MYRFVLTPRWLGFALFVVVLAAVCVRLGTWQFDRLDERKEENALVREHLDEEPRPVHDVVGPDDSALPTGQEWVPVTATGEYDAGHQVVEKYQTRDGTPGVDVVTPLVTESGSAVLVNRGWMEAPNNTASVDDIPEPERGTVTVTGWIRPDSGADADAVEPVDGQVRAVSSEGMGAALPYDAYPGYVNLTEQQPTAGGGLEAEPRPDLGQGPHFFYGLQWIFFATLAVFGWFYFAWTEAHPRPPRRGARNAGSPTEREPTEPSVRT